MDSCFALVGARQHCVAKICNASQRANLHKYCKVTRSRLKRFSHSISLAVYRLCLQFLADQVFYRSYVGSAYRLRSLAVSGFFLQALFENNLILNHIQRTNHVRDRR